MPNVVFHCEKRETDRGEQQQYTPCPFQPFQKQLEFWRVFYSLEVSKNRAGQWASARSLLATLHFYSLANDHHQWFNFTQYAKYKVQFILGQLLGTFFKMDLFPFMASPNLGCRTRTWRQRYSLFLSFIRVFCIVWLSLKHSLEYFYTI